MENEEIKKLVDSIVKSLIETDIICFTDDKEIVEDVVFSKIHEYFNK